LVRIFAFFVVLAAATVAPLLAQQDLLKRRPGPFLIYGPVRTVRDERATFKSENGTFIEEPRMLIQTIEYNEDGTRQDWTYYVPQGNIILRRVETYDPDGRVLETNNFQDGRLNDRVACTYDDQKQLIERVAYRRDGSVSSRTVFRRQGNQRESESWSYDFQGNIIAQNKTTNDLLAKRAQSVSINQQGVVQTESSMTENPDGGREFRTEQSNGDSKREVVTPLGKGGEERVTYNKDGTVRGKERFLREFDSYHNMIKTTHLTAKVDSSEFEPVEITYRTITYYEKN
jgi:hypothetical protein